MVAGVTSKTACHAVPEADPGGGAQVQCEPKDLFRENQ